MILGIVASSIAKETAEDAVDSYYLFDGGSTSYLTADDTTMLDSLVNQTWVVNARHDSDRTLASSMVGIDENNTDFLFELETDGAFDGKMHGTGGSSDIYNATWTADYTDYHQFALTYDGTNMIIYEDGVLLKSQATTGFVGFDSGNTLTIGNGGNTLKFKGEIRDVQIYSRALTAGELLSLAADITDYPTDHATYLEANFAGDKTSTTWTSEVGSYTVTNEGGVRLYSNYVFDGTSDSYFADETATPTLLNGITNVTFVIRVQRRINTHQHGILGQVGANYLKMEVDSGDDKMDCSISNSSVTMAWTNNTTTLDGGWYTYFMYFSGTYYGLYEDSTNRRNTASTLFTGFDTGVKVAIGAAVLGGTPGYLDGKISDFQVYNKKLSVEEIGDLATDITNIATTGLVANFARDKTLTTWTSENEGTKANYVLTNQGGVTIE